MHRSLMEDRSSIAAPEPDAVFVRLSIELGREVYEVPGGSFEVGRVLVQVDGAGYAVALERALAIQETMYQLKLQHHAQRRLELAARQQG